MVFHPILRVTIVLYTTGISRIPGISSSKPFSLENFECGSRRIGRLASRDCNDRSRIIESLGPSAVFLAPIHVSFGDTVRIRT